MVTVTPVLMVTEKLELPVLPAESFAWTVKLADPEMGVGPESTPALDRLRPTAVRLVAPVVTVQV